MWYKLEQSHNSLSALGAFLPKKIAEASKQIESHNSLSALGAFLRFRSEDRLTAEEFQSQ